MSGWSPNNSKYDCWQIKTVYTCIYVELNDEDLSVIQIKLNQLVY